MAKALRILSFVFLGIGLAAAIYRFASGKQIEPLYTWLPFVLSAACSVSYHRMAHPEKLTALPMKTRIILAAACFALIIAAVIAVIVLN